MHNCRETKEKFTELILDGAECSRDEALFTELRRCADCRTEFDALSATLGLTRRLREAVAPTETYWTGYHARLQEKLFHAKAQTCKENQALSFAPLRLCASFLKSSVSVPVPLGIVTVLGFLILALFAMRGVRSQIVPPPAPTVVHVPVEVPVVQEKVVTRVVYRDRRSGNLNQSVDAARINPTIAKSRSEEAPASLLGFKPTDEVKFTVIKGGSSNEK
jgi:hypothetical protein